jgi:hypothetical protein
MGLNKKLLFLLSNSQIESIKALRKFRPYTTFTVPIVVIFRNTTTEGSYVMEALPLLN